MREGALATGGAKVSNDDYDMQYFNLNAVLAHVTVLALFLGIVARSRTG